MKNVIMSFLILLFACTTKHNKIVVSQSLLDSIKKVSDTSFSKKYRTDDFAKATYYINKNDSTVFQLMYNKDSLLTQLIGTKNGKKIIEQSFYNNGQLKAQLQFDSFGKKTGKAIYYYENGKIERTALFKDGVAE